MNELQQLIEALGIWWKVVVVMLFLITMAVWFDLIVGNRIRTNANSIIGILTNNVLNKYVKTKKIMKANSLHLAYGRRYAVVNLHGRYYVVGKYQHAAINRRLKKLHGKLTYVDIMKNAIYWTK